MVRGAYVGAFCQLLAFVGWVALFIYALRSKGQVYGLFVILLLARVALATAMNIWSSRGRTPAVLDDSVSGIVRCTRAHNHAC